MVSVIRSASCFVFFLFPLHHRSAIYNHQKSSWTSSSNLCQLSARIPLLWPVRSRYPTPRSFEGPLENLSRTVLVANYSTSDSFSVFLLQIDHAAPRTISSSRNSEDPRSCSARNFHHLRCQSPALQKTTATLPRKFG